MISKLFLSRRNLETLISKLDRVKNGETSACAIIKYKNESDGPYMTTIVAVEVTAVEDEDYYKNRPAGMVHPADEPPLRHTTGVGVNLDL